MAEERGPGTRERILVSAIERIERDGAATLTTRAIAAAAGVNVAAINYYFRTKGALLRSALELAWANAARDFAAILEAPGPDAGAGLPALVTAMLEGGFRFPEMTRSIIAASPGWNAGGYAGESPMETMNGLLSRAALLALAVREAPAEPAFGMRLAMLLSAILFPIVSGGPGAIPWLGPLSDEAGRARYAAMLCDDFLAAVRRPDDGRAS